MANEAQYLYNLAARDIVKQASTQATGEAQRALLAFATVFGRQVTRDRHTRIKTMFNSAAQEASASMVRAYRKRPNKTNSSLGGIPYRNDDKGKNRRYSGNKLLDALSSTNMYKVTETGVKFIHTPTLDREAKQWKRLNFGTEGARGATTPAGRHYKMKIFGQVLPGDLGLFDIGPRDGFHLPKGYWSSTYPQKTPVSWDKSRRGQDFLILGAPNVPTKRGGATIGRFHHVVQTEVYRDHGRPSLGIQGSRFLDVGVGRLIQVFPIAIEKLLSEWFTEAAAGVGPVFKVNVGISPGVVAEGNRLLARVAAERAANARTRGFISRLP